MERKTHVISEATVAQCMRDPAFFTKLPEYTSLRIKAKVTRTAPAGGCTACTQRRMDASLLKDFNTVTGVLSADAVRRLKEYLGADTLMLRRADGSVRVF